MATSSTTGRTPGPTTRRRRRLAHARCGRDLSYDLTLPDDASVYVAVTAYDAEFESDYSNEKLLARTVPDFDGDGVGDTLDNCSKRANPAQNDTDLDDCGNLCDADYDNNGIVDSAGLGFFTQCFGTTNQ